MPYNRRFKPVVLANLTTRKNRTYARQNRSRTQKVAVVRGFTRTGGYYGRFRANRLLRGELKFLDTALAATDPTVNGVVFPNLVVVPQGDNQSERIGRKITLKSIWIRGNIVLTPQGAAAAATDVTRIIVVQDKQANGAAFGVTDVLTSANYLSFKDLENESRFVILKDVQIATRSTGGVAAATLEGNNTFNWYMKCNIPIEYDSSLTTGVIATQRSNSIAVLGINQGGLTTIQYNARIRYSDN